MGVLSNGARLGNMEAGTVAALVNTQFSVVSGGIGCIIGIAAIARFMPDFLRYELEHDGSPAREAPAPPLAFEGE